MAQLNNTQSVAVGVPTKLTNKGTLNAQTGTLLFTIPAHPEGKDFSAILQAIGSSLTGLSADLQVAADGLAADLANYKTTVLTAAAPVAAVSGEGANPLVAGALFAVNITALTGTACDIWIVIN